MRKAADYLVGTHDFSAFCKDRRLWDRNPICHLEKIEIEELPQQRLRIVLTGDHFLFRMARNIVGTLVHVGCGKIEAERVPAILEGQDRTQAGVAAPAHGLTLKRVIYKDLS
jgi:tRNA pseudouridine38-40 synthase